MGLRVAAFACAFNLLLWLSRAAASATSASTAGRWALAILGPACLLVIAARWLPSRRPALLGVATVSLAAAAVGWG